MTLTIGLNFEDVERVITLTPTHFRETVEFIANMEAGESIVEASSQAITLDNSTMSQVGTATLDVAAGDSITISGGIVPTL